MPYRDAWDMAAEICLSQLPTLVEDPNAEFQVSIVNLFSVFSFLSVLSNRMEIVTIRYNSIVIFSKFCNVLHVLLYY